jgi:hypothetical protein
MLRPMQALNGPIILALLAVLGLAAVAFVVFLIVEKDAEITARMDARDRHRQRRQRDRDTIP